MKTFQNILLDFTYISLLGLIFVNYLKVNKIWSRKHEPQVADSISVVAVLGEVLLLLPFFVANFQIGSINGIIKDIMGFIVIFVFFFIGIGYWTNNGFSFGHKLKRSLSMEGSEISRLFRDILGFKNLKKIFMIMCELCLIDKKLHEKEEALLRNFAAEYKLNYEKIIAEVKEKIANRSGAYTVADLNKDIDNYISKAPPKKVVQWLRDIVIKIIEIDSEVSEDENIIATEIVAKLNNYVMVEKTENKMFNLLLIPQDEKMEESILTINPKLRKIERPGAKSAYLAEKFYSLEFAEVVRQQYVDLFKCFVAIERF